MNLRKLWLGIGFLTLALVGGLSLALVHGQGIGLDLVLLIDSSGSTADTDPDALRIQAAEFLLDYVQSIGEARGLPTGLQPPTSACDSQMKSRGRGCRTMPAVTN